MPKPGFLLEIEPPPLERRCVEELIQANRAERGIWRLKIVMTGGNSPALRLNPRKAGALIMFLTPYEEQPAPAALCLYPEPVQRPLAKMKTLGYLDQLWIKEYAAQKGADDAIVTSQEGYWLETAVRQPLLAPRRQPLYPFQRTVHFAWNCPGPGHPGGSKARDADGASAGGSDSS